MTIFNCLIYFFYLVAIFISPSKLGRIYNIVLFVFVFGIFTQIPFFPIVLYVPALALTILLQFSETKWFLLFSHDKFPVFNPLKDVKWWNNVSKLALNEAIDEIRKTNFLKNIDIEWEALLSQQSFNYLNLCAAYEIDSLSTKIHLFKALDQTLDNNHMKLLNEHVVENFNISLNYNVILVNGDHLTMMTNPRNRSVLGNELTKAILSNI